MECTRVPIDFLVAFNESFARLVGSIKMTVFTVNNLSKKSGHQKQTKKSLQGAKTVYSTSVPQMQYGAGTKTKRHF